MTSPPAGTPRALAHRVPLRATLTEQLETFDVVIFQNFDFKPYFERDPNGLLGNIVRFVREGGAFVMVGGDRSFDLGEYAITPIAILPVRLGRRYRGLGGFLQACTGGGRKAAPGHAHRGQPGGQCPRMESTA